MPDDARTAHCKRIKRNRIAPATSYRSAWLAKTAAPSCVPSAARRGLGRLSGLASRWPGIVAIGDGRCAIEDAHAVGINAHIAIHRALGNRVRLTGDLPDMGLTIGFAGLTSSIAFGDGRFSLASLRRDGALNGRLLAIRDGSAVTAASDVAGRQESDEKSETPDDGHAVRPTHSRMAFARAK